MIDPVEEIDEALTDHGPVPLSATSEREAAIAAM